MAGRQAEVFENQWESGGPICPPFCEDLRGAGVCNAKPGADGQL